MLHASVVVIDNKAFVFCALEGIGKTTHAEQWKRCFGEKSYIFCDDRPLIGIKEDRLVVWNTPWSKYSEQIFKNSVVVQGICILEQSSKNEIMLLGKEDAVLSLLEQLPRIMDNTFYNNIYELYSYLLMNTNVWKLRCNISDKAVIMAYKAMENL